MRSDMNFNLQSWIIILLIQINWLLCLDIGMTLQHTMDILPDK